MRAGTAQYSKVSPWPQWALDTVYLCLAVAAMPPRRIQRPVVEALDVCAVKALFLRQ